ncbi:MAG: 5'-nucleotidase, lipoprotein e(P4) family [Myxococcota bacterium]
MRSTHRFSASARGAVLVASVCLACVASPRTPVPAQAAGAAVPAPADELLALSWQQTAAEYDALTRTVYALARHALDAALAQPDWDALPPEERARSGVAARGLPPAIILDIDETVLDNSPFAADLLRNPIDESLPPSDYGAAFGERWQAWVDLSHATRIAGAKPFLDYAASRGVEIFYVTNRECAPSEPAACEEGATCENLVEQRLPLKDCEQNLLLRNEQAPWLSDREKGSRRVEIGKRYRVLALFGDNLGDFVDGIYGGRAVRDALVCQHFAWWGERWFALPNPTYGSWVDAVDALGTRSFATRAERTALARQQKRDALVLPASSGSLCSECAGEFGQAEACR